MKNKLLMIGIALFMVMACTDDFEETNTNPNQPSDVPTSYLLSYAQELIFDQLYGGFDNSRVGMTLSQYWSQNQYTDESRYLYRSAQNNTTWGNFYLGLFNIQEIIRLNEEDPAARNENQIAIARIMKAWLFQHMTDVHGDIPYTEALGALGGNFAPTYTSQEEIYTDLLKELTEASNQINTGATGFTSGDLIYGGNMTRWKQLANALKLRVAIRAADRFDETSKAAIEEAVAAGVFKSNDDNAAFHYIAAQPNTNPLYVDIVVGGRIDFSSSTALLDLMRDGGDPRLPEYFEPAIETGTFVGRPFGQNANNANALNADRVSQLSEKVLSPEFPGKMMDYAEVNFILAEAAIRWPDANLGGDAVTFYQKAIRASMEDWGVENTAAIDAYITNHPLDEGNYPQTLGIQKWIALYMQGYQGWIEWRRLDFTNVLKFPVDDALIDIDQIPVRFVYPPDEQTLNRTNYNLNLERIGTDDFETRVWWDVK